MRRAKRLFDLFLLALVVVLAIATGVLLGLALFVWGHVQ